MSSARRWARDRRRGTLIILQERRKVDLVSVNPQLSHSLCAKMCLHFHQIPGVGVKMRARCKRASETERQTERMRWDYRDNVSRWREVYAPSGLSTPNGLKDFNGVTDKSMAPTFFTLESQSCAQPVCTPASTPPFTGPQNSNLASFSVMQRTDLQQNCPIRAILI